MSQNALFFILLEKMVRLDKLEKIQLKSLLYKLKLQVILHNRG